MSAVLLKLNLKQSQKMLKLGPKEMSGTIWDECDKSEIVQILISHEEDTIKAIQFAYIVDGVIHLSEMHGEPSGLKFDIVTFDYPCEYLVSLSGEYDLGGILVSVAFGTNKRKYGPFGGDDPESDFEMFNYQFGKIKSSFGGFHGAVANSCVNAIGVYVKPIVSLTEISIANSEPDTDIDCNSDMKANMKINMKN